jgi:uncharacterized metal-binding protein (TIGR02443 family)
MIYDEYAETCHFLAGLRCPNCLALDLSRLVLLAECDASAVVECTECGATARVLVTDLRPTTGSDLGEVA